MLTVAIWTLGATVLAGMALAAWWLKERQPPWAAAAVHGAAGRVGTVVLLALLWSGAADRQDFGQMAAWLIGAALLGGGTVVAAQLLRRRPSALVVILHATFGVAGFVMLLAYRALGR